MSKCDFCADDICDRCYGHTIYGIDCLNATLSTVKDYCDCEEPEL
jgi:hypothetical protein